MSISRRSFIGTSVGSGAVVFGSVGAMGGTRARAAQPDGEQPAATPFSSYTADAIAREVVGMSHANIDRVRELVSARPELANSAVDWGFGDWETALGAASHVGRDDIAELLMARGARPDIFTFAMLGNLDAVRACIGAAPGLQRLRGPHGLTLMLHARNGGERAASVVEYLGTLEGSDDAVVNQPVDDAAAIIGTYTIDPEASGGTSGTFAIAQGRQSLEFQLEGHSRRNLIHVGGLEFHTPGATSVRFRFTPGEGGGPARVAIDMVDRVVHASRQA